MLTAHFLNVGKGSCTIINFPSDRLAMIDIDNILVSSDNGLTDPIEYYKNRFDNAKLFRFILTHPDLDHMSGLHSFQQQVSIENFWDTNTHRQISDSEWADSIYRKEDWEAYQALRKSSSNPKTLRLSRHETADCCWVEDNITILSPTSSLAEEADSEDDYNHTSYVLSIEYGGNTLLLGGDASTKAWDSILEGCSNSELDSDVFLAPHHGSPNNVHDEAFDVIDPDNVIVSVHEGQDYAYDYYNNIANNVLSTKHYGNMVLKMKPGGDYEIINA